jgi:hypothetical protein
VKDKAYRFVASGEGCLLVLQLHDYACDMPIALRPTNNVSLIPWDYCTYLGTVYYVSK